MRIGGGSEGEGVPHRILPAMHTAEHILSAVLRRQHGCRGPLEAHLGDKKSKCDYAVRGPLDAATLRAIEAAVNVEIAADHQVSTRFVTTAEAEARFDLSRVPRGAARIRLVRIGELDECPCSGEHVERTSEIGQFVIQSSEMQGEARMRFRFRLLRPSQRGG